MTREEFEYAIKSCGCFIYRGQTYYEESELIKAFEDIKQEPTDENLHREREQAYMQGYEDASKRFRQEPSGDLISRQDAIKAIEEKAKRIKNVDTLNGLGGAIAILFDLPSVKPQPCKDAISRQAVHEAITRWAGSMSVLIALPTREVRPLLESIHKLPSVKPQEKTGHWIWQTEDIYRCSECGEDILVKEVMNVPQYKVCPMCEARMVEEQERSDKK